MTPEPTKLPELILSHRIESVDLDEELECGVCNSQIKKTAFLEHLNSCAAGTRIPHLMMNVFFLEDEVVAKDALIERNFIHLLNDEPIELRYSKCLYCQSPEMHVEDGCRIVKRAYYLGGMFQNTEREYSDTIKFLEALRNQAKVLKLKLQQKRKMNRITLFLQIVFQIEDDENFMKSLPANAFSAIKKIEEKDSQAVEELKFELRKKAEEESEFLELARAVCLEKMTEELVVVDIKNPRTTPFEFVNTFF